MPANFFHFTAITWFLRDFRSRSEYLSKCLLDFLNWSFCFPCLGSLILRPRQTSISAMLYLLPEGRWAHSPQISYQAHDNLTPDLSLTPPAPNATLPIPSTKSVAVLACRSLPQTLSQTQRKKMHSSTSTRLSFLSPEGVTEFLFWLKIPTEAKLVHTINSQMLEFC